MAHRALFQIKILCIIGWACVSGCRSPENSAETVYGLWNVAEANLSMNNGVIMKNNQPFSGALFTLYDGTTDTAELISYKNGREDGEWKKFYASKKIKEKREFKNGQKTGEYSAWWENGQQQLQYFFINDEYEGTFREWNESGRLVKMMNYKKGHEEGKQQWWYDNGKIKANYIIIEGRRFGLLGTKNCVNVSDSIFKN